MRLPQWLALGLLLALLGLLVARLDRLPTRIRGTVQADGIPVEAAQVRWKGQATVVHTDAAGRFHLPRSRQPPRRITAAREGFLIAGSPVNGLPLELQLRHLPNEDCERYEWVGPEPNAALPQNCGNCHGKIYREWSLSGHARSVSNPHFRNLYDGSDARGRSGIGWSLLGEHPDGAGVCTACHAPTLPFDDPAYFDLTGARGTAARGVHCDYCHKIADTTGTIGLTHGRFGLKLLRPAEGQLFFGPLDDVDRGEDTWSHLYRDSRYCASCHEGTVFGVHVYGTYTEWLASVARREGKQCQTCHQAPTGSLNNFAPGHGGIRRDPRTLGNHLFFAGSQEAMLRQSLRTTTQLERMSTGVRAVVELRAENVGHRMPTGFVDRHLVLVVDGLAADGKAIPPLSGPLLPALAGKNLTGHPGRLYGKVLKDFEGHSPAPFWRALPDATDTRLVPGRPDHVEFVFPADLYELRVRLLYRRFWQEVADAKGWSDNELLIVDDRHRPHNPFLRAIR